MATLTVTEITPAGSAPAPVAADVGGDTFTNSGNEFLWVNNGGGAPITVTIPTTGTVVGHPIADGGGTVPNGEIRRFGPFQQTLYGSSPAVTYSDVTSVTVEAVRLPNPPTSVAVTPG